MKSRTKFNVLSQNADLFLAFGVVGILVVMVIPMPTILLDLMLSLNITMAVIILLVAIYTKKPLDFSVFPSVLLVATLFRLSLKHCINQADSVVWP